MMKIVNEQDFENLVDTTEASRRTRKGESMRSVAIIGSGIGGLVAGNLFAKKGYKVTIFESHSAPGGYTAGFWRKGFYFESGTVSFEASQVIFDIMKKIGVFDKMEFVRQSTRWFSPDFDCVPNSWEDLKKALLEAYVLEQEDLFRYFAEIDKLFNIVCSVMPGQELSSGTSIPFELMKDMGIGNNDEIMTVAEFTAQYIKKDSRAYQILKAIGFPDMSVRLFASSLLLLCEDYWTVKTGMQSWADVLADNFKKLGGTLMLKSCVDRIITKNGAAIGVASNDKVFNTDYVLSACDYKKTFLNLLDERSILPKGFKDKVETARVSEGFFTVYLGLNLPHEKMQEYLKVPHVYYFSGEPGDFHNLQDEKFFEKKSFTLYSPSLMNRDLAPEGKSSLMIMVMCPYGWMNNWCGADKKMYRKLKDGVKNTLIEQASAIIPRLKKYIEFDESATPLTYERFTHNTDGASSAWSWNLKNRFYKDVLTIEINTPVRNLYISSCWSAQAGGVPSAVLAAYKCINEIEQS
jgi:phytoene dehydrogenase-like protein